MNYYYIFVISGVFASSCSQLLLKKSADREHESWVRSMLNWRVITAYCILFCSLVINITAFSHGVMLKDMPALESLSAIFIPVLSYFFLKEKIDRRRIIACVIIVVGIYVFYS